MAENSYSEECRIAYQKAETDLIEALSPVSVEPMIVSYFIIYIQDAVKSLLPALEELVSSEFCDESSILGVAQNHENSSATKLAAELGIYSLDIISKIESVWFNFARLKLIEPSPSDPTTFAE
ncbi:MAG: hypothetical protein WCW30_02755 [Candidatus Gracilibacteria bacterium]